MLNPFYSDREKRPRALWRLLFQYAVYQVGAVLLASLTLTFLPVLGETGLMGGLSGSLAVPPGSRFIGYAAALVAAVASVWLAGRLLDRRPFLSGFGLRLSGAWWLDFGFGLVLGALLMAGVFLVELASGWVTVIGAFETVDVGAFLPAILAPVVLFVCVGIYEEMVSRGYQLQNMAEGLNHPSLGGAKGAVVFAWVLSSAVFGLLHLGNPSATAISTFNITLAGLMLGTGYVLTGRLAIPIGLHITWNFFQGNVFGFPVSGIEPIGATFVGIEQGGPPLLTGGAFGPEAGLLGLGAMVVGSLLIALWVRARSGKATLATSIAEPPVDDGTKAAGVDTGDDAQARTRPSR